jgi:hypothetical protein
MVNRRSVLKAGAATVAGALVRMPASGRYQLAMLSHVAFRRAVFDERFAECRAFAAELKGAAILTSAIRADVARLWYEDLRVHLREKRVSIAGLTDRPALFCLEELARYVGMRVIFRADKAWIKAGRRGTLRLGRRRWSPSPTSCRRKRGSGALWLCC